MVVSCGGGSGEKGWRTEWELGRGQSFEDHHGAATSGTAPKRACWLDQGSVWFGLRRRHGTEQLEAKRQKSGPFAVGQKAEVADAHETLGEQVQEKAAQELVER